MQAKLLTLCMALCVVCLTATSQNVPDYVPTDGLVAWYPFNGNANDESGNENDGEIIGPELTVDRFDLNESAFEFENSRIEIANSADLDQFKSISFWFLTSSTAENQVMFKQNIYAGHVHERLSCAVNWGGNAHFAVKEVCGDPWQYDNVVVELNDGMWHHYVGVLDSIQKRLYIDGVLLDESSFVPETMCSGGDLIIGQEWDGVSYDFIGTLDDFGFWNRALIEEEILTLYNAQLPVPGCTDSIACNFNEEANNEDDSCVYPLFGEDCETGAAACGEGTEWDVTVQACVVPEFCQEDLDGDGVIGVNDLMQLLSVFGTDCPIWMCGDPVNYDGYDYATVQIGEQCWFAENLRNTHYANGDDIPGNLNDSAWVAMTVGAQAVFGEGANDCINAEGTSDPDFYDFDVCNEFLSLESFGRLYNSFAVTDSRGVCQVGWHVASNTDWTFLEEYLELSGFAGLESEVLKSVSGWPMGSSGTDDFGFGALPGGQRTADGFSYAGGFGRIFSPSGYASAYRDFWGNGSMPTYVASSTDGLSVRCIKDTE